MNSEDLFARSAADALALRKRVLSSARLLNEVDGASVAVRALGNALVIVVQEYLESNSNPDDVELFFEVHGQQPAELMTWPTNILAGLRRNRIPAADREAICARAVANALHYIESSSQLAWGDRREPG